MSEKNHEIWGRCPNCGDIIDLRLNCCEWCGWNVYWPSAAPLRSAASASKEAAASGTRPMPRFAGTLGRVQMATARKAARSPHHTAAHPTPWGYAPQGRASASLQSYLNIRAIMCLRFAPAT